MAENVGREANNVHTLAYAAQLGIPGGVDDPARLGQTVTEAECGCCYRFEFHATGRSSKGESFRAQVLYDGTVVREILLPNLVEPQYSYFSTYVPCVPPGTTVDILFIKPGVGTWFVDDVGFIAEGPCSGGCWYPPANGDPDPCVGQPESKG
ncbi:MAG: hypothetical protein PHH46_09395 [Firmicutes bacterium]|nr:hypothetical protein [Bacillota bacterium]